LSTVRPTLGLRTAEDKTISQLILLRLESQKHNFWCYLRLCRTFYHQRRPHTVLAPSVKVFDLLPLTFRSIIVSPMTSHLPSARWHATRRRLTDRSRDENSKRIRQKYNKTLNSCPITSSNISRFSIFFADRLSGKFATNSYSTTRGKGRT